MSKKANQLTNQIIDYIYKNGGYSWKQNSGGVYDKNIGIFRTGAKKGISDILGIYKGKFIACEVKIGKDHLSPEQIGFLRNVEHAGGISIVAKDFIGFQEEWNKKVIHTSLPLDIVP